MSTYSQPEGTQSVYNLEEIQMHQEKIIVMTEQDLTSFIQFPNSSKLYKVSDLIPKLPRKRYRLSTGGKHERLISMYKYAMETGTWRTGAPYDRSLAEMKYNQLMSMTTQENA